MKLKRNVLVTLLSLYGLYAAFKALTGGKTSRTKGTQNQNQIPPLPSFKMVGRVLGADRIVLIVIDALRLDFITQNHYNIPFMSKVIDDGKACLFQTKVRPPTVTLPRLKALLTGDIPSYTDLIRNLSPDKSNYLRDDENIIGLAKAAGKRVVFYGDDTWLRIVDPMKNFKRFSGVSSLFVSDFEEVDLNVSSGMEKELRGDDWDFLILHYLGLDHIGHVYGPNSSLVPPKLRQMDAVVKKVAKYLSASSSSLPSYIIVTGDHGMANLGGHGGASFQEITTPLVLVSSKQGEPMECSGKGLELRTIQQTDIAPTLSVLWGLDFPSDSIGKIIPSWVRGQRTVGDEEILQLLYSNVLHLLSFYPPDYKPGLLNQTLAAQEEVLNGRMPLRVLISLYETLLSELSEGLESGNDSEMKGLIVGSLLSAEAFLFTLVKADLQPLGAGPMGVGTTLLLFSIFGEGIEICVWVSSLAAALLAHNLLGNIELLRNSFWKKPRMTSVLLLAAPFCLFSTSFIEEEHFLRHYTFTTGVLYVTMKNFNFDTVKCCTVILLLHRLASTWCPTGVKWSDLPGNSTFIDDSGIFPVVLFVSIGVIFFLRRSSRRIFHATLLLVVLFKVSGLEIGGWAQLCFFLIFFNIGLGILKERGKRMTDGFLCLVLLLARIKNIPLVGILLYILDALDRLTVAGKDKINLYVLLYHAAFFYQGNSNNIASIDVAAGYIGVRSYNAPIVGFLTYFNTLSGPILVGASFLEKEGRGEGKGFLSALTWSGAWAGFIYTIVLLILREHLFVWSVLAPKVLFLAAFLILQLAVLVGTVISSKFPSRTISNQPNLN